MFLDYRGGPTLHGSGLWEGTMIYVSGLQGRTNHTLIRTLGEDTSSIGPDLQQKDQVWRAWTRRGPSIYESGPQEDQVSMGQDRERTKQPLVWARERIG